MTTKEIEESRTLLEDGRDSINLFREMLKDQCEGDINVSMETLEEILTPIVTDIADKISEDQVDNSKDEDVIQERVEAELMARDGFSFRSLYNDAVIDPEDIDTYDEETEAELKDIFKNLITVILGERNLKILDKETDDNVAKRLKYFSSTDYDKMLEKRKGIYEEKLKEENIKPELKKELQHKIAMIDDRYVLSFMMKAFGKTEKSKQEAIDRLTRNFFDKRRSEYLMRRFFDRCARYGVDPHCYKKATDLEERYLPEEYHPFSNFFLFISISHVAYIYEENGAIEAYLILGNLEKLFANAFPTEEAKQLFLNRVMEMLDVFKPYKEKFEKENQLWSKHPMRIKKENERDKQLKELIYKRIEGDRLTEDGKITPEIEAMSVKELLEFCKMRERQKEYWESRFINEEDINSLYDMVSNPSHTYKEDGYHFDEFAIDNEETEPAPKKDYIISVWPFDNRIFGTGVVAYDWRHNQIRFVGNLVGLIEDEIEKLKEIMDKLPDAVFLIARGFGMDGAEYINRLKGGSYRPRIFYTEGSEPCIRHYGVTISHMLQLTMFKVLQRLIKLNPALFRSGTLVDEISSLQKNKDGNILTNTANSRVHAFATLFYAIIFIGGFDRYGIQVSASDFGNIYEEVTKELPKTMFLLKEEKKSISSSSEIGRGATKPIIWPAPEQTDEEGDEISE